MTDERECRVSVVLTAFNLSRFVGAAVESVLSQTFSDFELIAVGFSAVIAAFIARDGRCNWLEGAQLLAVYAILALAFFFIPN